MIWYWYLTSELVSCNIIHKAGQLRACSRKDYFAADSISSGCSIGKGLPFCNQLHHQAGQISIVSSSLVPRPETARRKGPGFHCLRMR